MTQFQYSERANFLLQFKGFAPTVLVARVILGKKGPSEPLTTNVNISRLQFVLQSSGEDGLQSMPTTVIPEDCVSGVTAVEEKREHYHADTRV